MRPVGKGLAEAIDDFNSHTPHGVRLIGKNSGGFSGSFQLTHPTRGATSSLTFVKICKLFQLTHPTRGATIFAHLVDEYVYYFNSHTPHGVRHDIDDDDLDDEEEISTHTPHTGCDTETPNDYPFFSISTHTPHTGCDILFFNYSTCLVYFNSHTPHGVRQFLRRQRSIAPFISTHTPHTGCDVCRVIFKVLTCISTHTPHTGCDE